MAKNFATLGETVIGALASDDTPRHARLDDTTHDLIVVSHLEESIHAGAHFYYNDSVELGSTDSQDYLITTPNTTTWAHMLVTATGSAITQYELYEGTDRTGSTDVVTFNNNRNSTDTATVVVSKGTTGGTTDGTRIYITKSGSTTNQSRSPTAGGKDRSQIILAQNTKYIARLTSSSSSNLCNMRLSWGEHTNLT